MTDETMTSEYPDRVQRFAVCVAQWSTSRGTKERKASTKKDVLY